MDSSTDTKPMADSVQASAENSTRDNKKYDDLSHEVLTGKLEKLQAEKFEIARYFMEQSGEAQDPTAWIPFVTVVGEGRLAATQATGEDGAWKFARPWKKDSAPLRGHLPTDLMGSLIRLRGSVISMAWKDEVVEMMRSLTIEMERVTEAPISAVLEVAKLFLGVDLAGLSESYGQLARFVGLGLWQLTCLIQRRWPQAKGVDLIATALKEHVTSGVEPLRTLSFLISDDYGRELKRLIRTRQDPFPYQPSTSGSTIQDAFAAIPVQYCPQQDIGILCLPNSGNNSWAVDMGTNSIRLIETGRLVMKHRNWKLSAVEGEGEDIIIPSLSERDNKWVLYCIPSS